MASVSTTTATMAAAGFDKRRPSNVSSLQTPASGTFPSEMLSPMAGSPGFPRKDDLKTPITPPSAYLDFLKSMSPAMLSPAPTSAGGRFSFNDKPFDRSFESGPDRSALASPPVSQPTSQPTSQPASLPPLSRHTSSDSAASTGSHSSSTPSAAASMSSLNRSSRARRPDSPRVIIPPASSFAKPGPRSARTPRRLHIPQSPYSQPPGSAHSVPQSPYSNTPICSTPWSASFSPRGAEHDGDAMAKPGRVSVRQVVTRTVTYCRTPLDPAPKGKRRKIEVDGEAAESSRSVAASPALSEERPVKKEKRDDGDDNGDTASARTPRSSKDV